MINNEIARVFERIADLLEIEGADGFRINSYRRASRTVKDTSEDLSVLAVPNDGVAAKTMAPSLG